MGTSSWVKVGLAVIAFGCGGGGDAAGTLLVRHEFSEAEGGPPTGAHQERELDQQVAIGDALVSVSLITVTANGGQYLGEVAVEVVDSAGGAMTASVAGNPVNRGTTEAPIASRHVELTWQKQSACSTSRSTKHIELRGDGTIHDL